MLVECKKVIFFSLNSRWKIPTAERARKRGDSRARASPAPFRTACEVLPSLPFHYLSADVPFEDRTHSKGLTNAKNTTVLQSTMLKTRERSVHSIMSPLNIKGPYEPRRQSQQKRQLEMRVYVI